MRAAARAACGALAREAAVLAFAAMLHRFARRARSSAAAAAACALVALPASAQEISTSGARAPDAAHDAKAEAPTVAWAYTAFGAPAGSVGAQAYGLGLAGPRQSALLGGGVLAWAALSERVTLVVDAPRDVYREGHFAPSAAAIVRLVGKPGEGFSLGALGKYKVDGFGVAPGGELESEAEAGLLASYVGDGLHLDLNAITGVGLTDEGEVDTEVRARVGYDVASFVRIGLDGQGRYRLAGTKRLPSGASWDFAGGPQVVVGKGQLFGALTAGPATMGLATANAIGATAMLTLCGTI